VVDYNVMSIYIYIYRERGRGAELAFRMNMENTRFPILAKKKKKKKEGNCFFLTSLYDSTSSILRLNNYSL
jgi:hypothetical protein